jgi:transposase
VTFHPNPAALEEPRPWAGGRSHVTHVLSLPRPLQKALEYSRDECLVERGFHRFKRGSRPALPLFGRWPEHLTGRMLLLMIAWQWLTRLELVAHRI